MDKKSLQMKSWLYWRELAVSIFMFFYVFFASLMPSFNIKKDDDNNNNNINRNNQSNANPKRFGMCFGGS